MTTDAQLIAWLRSDTPAARCVLLEVGVQVNGVETTRYISDKGYVSGPSESPSNTFYNPLISGGVQFTESLSLEGSTGFSYGTIELLNNSGDIDSWLDDVWTNRSIKIYIGDVTWPRADFYPIFDGVVSSVDSPSRDKFTILLSDKSLRLNTTLSEVKLGGTTTNSDKLIPILFGECHNITPLLIDSALEKYQVHNGPIESIIEVRDNGAPVSFTPDILTGTFVLNQAAAGTITCSAQGYKPVFYTNNVSELIQSIVVNYGNVNQKLTVADLDAASLAAFASANIQPVGIYITEKANVMDICNKLASSVGARIAFNRQGKLYLVKLDLTGINGGTNITKDDMTFWSLNISQRPSVKAAVKLGYDKNYTVQTSLAAGLPPNHVELFAQDWITTTAKDETVATKYKLFTDPVTEETQLKQTADAVAEANRRLNLFKVQRKVLKYNGMSHLMLEKLGNPQTITHERFGLSGGVSGQIISLTTNWLDAKIDIEVLV